MVDCTDSNRFREISPGQFFNGYRDPAHLPKFADAGAPLDGDLAAPSRPRSRRLAAQLASLADGSGAGGGAGGVDSSSDVPVVDISAAERASAAKSKAVEEGGPLAFGASQPQNSTQDCPHEAAGVHAPGSANRKADSSGKTAVQSLGHCPGTATCAESSPERQSAFIAVGCIAPHAATQPLQSAHAVATAAQTHTAVPQVDQQVDTAAVAMAQGEGAPDSDREPEQTCEQPAGQAGGASRAARAPPASSPRRKGVGSQSPSSSPARSPARRRARDGGQHMLKLKDFPPSAEFSRVMGRHNQVRCESTL